MRTRAVLWVAAAALLLLATVLLLDNVEVSVRERDLDGRSGAVGCVVAPWDAVVNDQRGAPGGEHAQAYADAVAAACARTNKRRFAAGVTCAAGALLLAAAAAARGGRRRTVRGDGGAASGRPAAADGAAT